MPFRDVHFQPTGLDAAVVQCVNILGRVTPAVEVEGTQALEHLHVTRLALAILFQFGDLPDRRLGCPMTCPCTFQPGASAPPHIPCRPTQFPALADRISVDDGAARLLIQSGSWIAPALVMKKRQPSHAATCKSMTNSTWAPGLTANW